jgi:uncharacterized protein with PIN domain
LNDFLPAERRGRDCPLSADADAPLRHLIECCGVPHTEVALVLRDNESLDLETPVAEGDRLDVYSPLDARRLRADFRTSVPSVDRPRFVADTHLGRLARQLRMLGFDTLWEHIDVGDERLAERAATEGRILLSSDRRLLMRRNVKRGCFIRSGPVWEQLVYLNQRLDLCGTLRPFSRCMRCNARVLPVPFEEVRQQVPPRVRELTDRYWRCGGCAQLYWRGTHWRDMRTRVKVLCPEFVLDGGGLG